MDFHLKQWRDHHQDESDEQQQLQPSPAKFPRLLLQTPDPSSSVLPLFSPQHTKINNTFSSYPDSKPPLPPPSRLSNRLSGNFSVAQWQELELQALIFRHMVAGASVPPELLQLVKKSLLNSPSYYSYYQPSLLQAGGYWGRAAMDPEPGRCRRTDGKKWRCSRDVVPGQKYCERHVHRGRNRSRKPVEFAATSTTTSALSSSSQQGVHGGGGTQFSLSAPTSSSLDIFQLNQGASEPKTDRKFLFDTQNDTSGKTNDRVLRHFFDDWPRSGNVGETGASPANSATCLSISTPGGNQSLDFLKLSTGNGGDERARRVVDGARSRSEWSGGNQVGGPLAEALRSSTASSPTSVLHQLPRSGSGASYVSV